MAFPQSNSVGAHKSLVNHREVSRRRSSAQCIESSERVQRHSPLGFDTVLDGQYRVRRFAPTQPALVSYLTVGLSTLTQSGVH